MIVYLYLLVAISIFLSITSLIFNFLLKRKNIKLKIENDLLKKSMSQEQAVLFSTQNFHQWAKRKSKWISIKYTLIRGLFIYSFMIGLFCFSAWLISDSINYQFGLNLRISPMFMFELGVAMFFLGAYVYCIKEWFKKED